MENTPKSADVSNFFKEDFKDMFMAFFLNPVSGHQKNFQKSSDKAMMESAIIMGGVFVIFFLCFIIMLGTGGMGMLFKMSLFPISMMVMISGFSFALKSVSGKPDFKQEMLTGALCGIPLAMGIIIITILSFITDGGASMNPMGGSILSTIIMLYLLLMMIGVFQQSLQAGGTKDAMAWFVSPAAILLAAYLTGKIVVGMM